MTLHGLWYMLCVCWSIYGSELVWGEENSQQQFLWYIKSAKEKRNGNQTGAHWHNIQIIFVVVVVVAISILYYSSFVQILLAVTIFSYKYCDDA